ncbi:ferredoxin [Granulicatella seriolae]|uniref:Ferredoxin n=1 Tax=Granulicatella seriolae TaxID=2967226 RepID=A0ABT1WMZ1_9LACT|nr:ferredoxin [Granulicatella seriolae]
MTQSPSNSHQSLYTYVECPECIACGLCELRAKNIFKYTEDGLAYVFSDKNTGTLPIKSQDIEAFKSAYRSCPTGAIKRSNQPFDKDTLV